MNKKQIQKYFVCLIILILSVFSVKIYSKLKIDGAIEAANVFTSPSHSNLFDEHFTPFSDEHKLKCYNLAESFRKSSEISLIDSNWKGIYIFRSENIKYNSYQLILHSNGNGKWLVECNTK